MDLHLEPSTLRIVWTWSERVWAVYLSPELALPLTAMTQVSTHPPTMGLWDLRAPGTAIPGVMRAGTFYTKQGREFWSVTAPRDPAGYLVLDLAGLYYQRVVLKMGNNESWAMALKTAIAPTP
ncbi:hypothetical protein [Prochlorothrix hollandica]|uniref:Uncharacterized protein n=1 Tax=Prochlorothrix hollandica PCC 9006 = CALU 1027 TaxID=317619 RepID=A0A0M2PYX9_PROHO|nr:hypothetical protein [Prochlorothrix hollandica]KKI99888.1 hypothetical protein PROH_08750 [Prochlorothrix hollandica PCC 9006 = CALU 1027]